MNTPRSIHIAILALGGQGGGVLVDWLVALAERAGWTAQATSVAGVAQRTGATIYYLELVEPTPGRTPVLALMPVPGDVDVLIASELMEAGRAVERGLVTPDRTTVIASSHRTYAVQEKMVPGNGVADSAAVLDIVRAHARHCVIDDMQALAVRVGSVISASLFGALAGSGALPFAVADFEAVVEASGVGVGPSLAAMRAALEVAQQGHTAPAIASLHTAPRPLPERATSSQLQPLLERIRSQFPPAAWDWLGEGLARVVDWQDIAYGQEYLDCVAQLLQTCPPDDQLAIEAARWIAVAMSYDDVIRVADLKTRATRFARMRGEIAANAQDVSGSEEYFHPRLEEVMGLLPQSWANRLDTMPRLTQWLARRLDQGRRIHPHTVGGYLLLRSLASLRRWRRASRRHAQERAHWQHWLAQVAQAIQHDPALARELLHCRRLVKGYSDTHARGTSRFDRLLQAAQQLQGRPDAASALAALRQAALRDAEGGALQEQWRALQLVE